MLIIYLLISSLIFFIEFKIWKTITPTIIIFSGITVISIIHSLLWNILDLTQVNSIIFAYLALFLLISFTSSFLARFSFSLFKKKNTLNPKLSEYQYNKKLKTDSVISSYQPKNITLTEFFSKSTISRIFLILMFLLLTFIFYAIIKAYKINGVITGEAFENLLSYGAVGHSFALLMACTPITYLFFKFSTTILLKRIFLIILCTSLIFLFLKQVKYWVLVPSVWIALINFYIYGIKFNPKSLLRIVSFIFLCVIFFFSTYFFSFYILEDGFDIYEATYDITYHFIGYLSSGLIVFSSLLNDGYLDALQYRDVCSTFTGACNIIGFFDGSGLYTENPFLINFYVLDNVYNKTGNVPTLWGVFMIHLGWSSFVFYFFLSYFIYFIFIFSRTSLPFFLYYTGLISFMSFSWFASYFGLLSIYQIPLLSLFVTWFLFDLSKKKPSRLRV